MKIEEHDIEIQYDDTRTAPNRQGDRRLSIEVFRRYVLHNPIAAPMAAISAALSRGKAPNNIITALCRDEAMVRQTKQGVTKSIQDYRRGKNVVMHYIWPTVLGGLIAADFADFFWWRANEGYDAQWWDFFTGFDPRAWSISTNLGSDLIASPSGWMSLAIMAGVPISFGILNALCHRVFKPNFMVQVSERENEQLPLITESAQQIMQNVNITHKHLARLMSYGSNPSPNQRVSLKAKIWLQQATFELCYYHADINPEGRRLIFEKINSLATSSNPHWRRQGIKALLNIVYHLRGLAVNSAPKMVATLLPEDVFVSSNEVRLNRLGRQADQYPIENRLDLYHAALNMLTKIAINNNKERYFVQRRLWELGENNNPHYQDIILPRRQSGWYMFKNVALLGAFVFAEYRYWLFITKKLIISVKYIQNKAACESKAMHYVLDLRTGNYQCLVCPNHSYVFDQSSLQSCVTGILTNVADITSINQQLRQLLKVTQSLPELDLSEINYFSWPLERYRDFFRTINQFSGIQRVNAGTTLPDTPRFISPKLPILSQFLNQTMPTHLMLPNRHIGTGMTELLAVSRTNKNLQELDLTQCSLTDETVRNLFPLPPQLNTVRLGGNQLTDDFAEYWATAVTDQAFALVDFHDNGFKQRGIDAMGDFLINNPLTEQMDLSGMNLNGLNYPRIGQGFSRSSLKVIRMNGCGLSDFDQASLSPYLAKVPSVDIGNNEAISDQTMNIMMDHFATGKTERVLLGKTPLSNPALQTLGSRFHEGNFSFIDLSYREQQDLDFASFFSNIQGKQRVGLNLAYAKMDKRAVRALIAAIENGIIQPTYINVIGNRLGDKLGAELARVAIRHAVEVFYLANTGIGTQSCDTIRQALPGSNVQDLDVSLNRLPDQALRPIIQVFKDTKLQRFTCDRDWLLAPDTVAVVAEQLLTDIPLANLQQLREPVLSLELARRIHTKSKPATQLRYIHMQDANAKTNAGTALCHVQLKANLLPNQLNINTNGTNPLPKRCAARAQQDSNRSSTPPLSTVRNHLYFGGTQQGLPALPATSMQSNTRATITALAASMYSYGVKLLSSPTTVGVMLGILAISMAFVLYRHYKSTPQPCENTLSLQP